MAHLITSHKGADHVESKHAAHWNAGTLGNGCYVLPIGSKLACTMTDSNTLRVLFGVGSVCGYDWEIEGDYEEVDIDNGVPGYNRIDLLVARVETAPAEKVELKVYKGEETTGTPVQPGYVQGDLNDGDTVCEMPICTVRVTGINPQAPVMLAEESIDIMALMEELRDYKSQMQMAGGIRVGGIATAKLADGAVTPAKIADGAVGTADLAAKAVTSAKLADTAVSDKLAVTYEAAVSDFGTLYVIGGKIGIMQVYCKKTAATAAWGEITAKLPGGYKSAESMACSLTCEDHPEREAICLVAGDTVRIQNRSSTAWTAGSTGFYLRGQVVFPVA